MTAPETWVMGAGWHGALVDATRLAEVLDEYNVPGYDTDTDTLPDDVVSDPAGWVFAAGSCAYARKTIAGWKKDTPTARHPWLLAQLVRLSALHAHGCLTEADHAAALTVLRERFAWLLEHREPRRAAGHGELADAYSWGRAHVARYPAERIARELGNHPHLVPGQRGITGHADPPGESGNHTGTTREPPAGGSGNHTGTTREPPAAPAPELVDVNNPAALLQRNGPTEKGMAAAFAALHHPHVCYCPDTDQWMVWDGRRWARDIVAATREMLLNLAAHVPTGPGWDAHKKRMLSDRGVTAALNLARSDPRLVRRIDEFDTHPDQLNTPAGILDLRTSTLHPHDPRALHTKITAVAPDFDADQSRWRGFLAETFDNDSALIDWLHRALGYYTTGLVREHLLLFCWGTGNNGKSVLFETLRRVLGDYAWHAPTSLLMTRRGDQSSNDIANLVGRRFVICTEVNETDRVDEARFKALTGGDMLTARFLYKDYFEFPASHHLILSGNHKPAIDVGGTGTWRRLRLVPFNHQVPADQQILGLADLFIDKHAPAVLAWLVQGAAGYFARGLGDEPEAVRVKTEQYRASQDHISAFLADRCHLAPGNGHVNVVVKTLRAAYESWCSDVGELPLGRRRFADRLHEHGVDVGTNAPRAAAGGPRLYGGIGLLADEGQPRADLK